MVVKVQNILVTSSCCLPYQFLRWCGIRSVRQWKIVDHRPSWVTDLVWTSGCPDPFPAFLSVPGPFPPLCIKPVPVQFIPPLLRVHTSPVQTILSHGPTWSRFSGYAVHGAKKTVQERNTRRLFEAHDRTAFRPQNRFRPSVLCISAQKPGEPVMMFRTIFKMDICILVVRGPTATR